MSEKIIHLIEDTKLLQEMISDMLTKRGFSVTCFDNGLDFLKYVVTKGNSLPDLILSDYHLNGSFTGADIAKHLREMGNPWAEVPFVGLSDSHPEAASKFKEQGVSFLEKAQFRAGDLIAVVRNKVDDQVI